MRVPGNSNQADIILATGGDVHSWSFHMVPICCYYLGKYASNYVMINDLKVTCVTGNIAYPRVWSRGLIWHMALPRAMPY